MRVIRFRQQGSSVTQQKKTTLRSKLLDWLLGIKCGAVLCKGICRTLRSAIFSSHQSRGVTRTAATIHSYGCFYPCQQQPIRRSPKRDIHRPPRRSTASAWTSAPPASSEQELGALRDRVQVGLHAELCWLGRRLSRCPQRSLEAAGAAALGCRWTARAALGCRGGRRPRHPRHLPGKLIRRGLPRLGSPPTPTVQRSSLSHWRLDSSRVLWQLCQNCSQSNRQPLRQSSAARVMKSVR